MNKITILIFLISFSLLNHANEFNNTVIEINVDETNDWGIKLDMLGDSKKNVEFQVKISEEIQSNVCRLTPKIISLIDPIRSTWSMYEVRGLPLLVGYNIRKEVLPDSYLEILLKETISPDCMSDDIILKIYLKDLQTK